MQAVFCYSGSFKGQFIIIKNEIFKLTSYFKRKFHYISKVRFYTGKLTLIVRMLSNQSSLEIQGHLIRYYR